MKTYFTSDNHFFHKSIMKFCPETRMGNTDAKEMNEQMIDIWNKTVGKNDTVYTLGDFSFGKTDETIEIVKRLNGHKHLILGNHDHWINDEAKSHFASVNQYKKIKVNGQRVILFHYPIVEFENMHHGAYHFYGHVHGNYQHPGRAIDVGIDARPQCDMGLWEWEELVPIMEGKPVLSHHGKTID
jgi:calcineurin-like phosphoesterase family protein